MAKRVTITFPSDRPYDFYATHVFWFAEALGNAIRQAGLGTLNDIDLSRDVIRIDLADQHDLGRVKSIVRKTLGRHSLAAEAVVTAS